MRLEQDTVSLMPGTAYRWQYEDGIWSQWRLIDALRPDWVAWPHNAVAMERLKGEAARQAVRAKRSPAPARP